MSKYLLAKSILLFLGIVLFSSKAFSERIFVVVHEDNASEINAEVVKLIYSDKLSFWENGEEILVFELPVKSVTREKFAQNILNKSALSSQRDWSNRFVNNTIKNDVKIKPQRLVVRFVGIKESAIGYVSESQINDIPGIKVVMTIE